MTLDWEPWLARLAAERHGALDYQGRPTLPSIQRGRKYVAEIAFNGDMTGKTYSAAIALVPDAAPLLSFGVVVGAFTGGVTTITLDLTQSAVLSLPADGDFDGLLPVAFELSCTSAGHEGRVLAGRIYISGSVAA